MSQSLWLRLSRADNFTLALSRVFQVLAAALWIGLISLVWVFWYAVLHRIAIELLLPPVLGLLCYIFFSSGLVLLMAGKPTTRMVRRTAFVLLAFAVPMLLYAVGKDMQIVRRCNGYFPYALPLGINELTIEAERAYKTAGIIGLLIMAVSLIRPLILPLFKNI